MAAKAVVRDVGRVLDLPYMFCDGLSADSGRAGQAIQPDDAVEMEPILKDRLAQEEEVAEPGSWRKAGRPHPQYRHGMPAAC